jgi:plasmid stability protein
MASRVKKRTDTSTNRESDKIIVRLPAGMRDQLAQLAARHGKSMNAEVVTALQNHFARGGARPDQDEVMGLLGEMKQTIDNLRDVAKRYVEIGENPWLEDLISRLKEANKS